MVPMQQLLRHQISNFHQPNGYIVSVGHKVPLGKKYYMSSKWIKGDVSKCILVVDTYIFVTSNSNEGSSILERREYLFVCS